MEIKIATFILLFYCIASAQSNSFWSNGKHHLYFKVKTTSDSTYYIIWGNEYKRYQSSKVFQINIGNNSTYSVIDFSTKYIVAKQSCGTSCTQTIFLSFNGREDIQEYFCCLAYNLARDLVCYIDSDLETIIIKNIRNEKVKKIKIDNLCPASSGYLCLKKAHFINNVLHIQYNGSLWSPNNEDIHNIKVNCDFN